MKPILLSSRNPHPRDVNIVFEEQEHKYTILTDINSKYTSVTTWVHSHFPHFDADLIISKMMSGRNWNANNKYWGKTPEQIKQLWNNNQSSLANAGTELHFRIECFMNHPSLPVNATHCDLFELYIQDINTQIDADAYVECKEWNYFLNFIQDFPLLKPFRTEWTIYNEDWKISGSIDMVYENDDGTLSIYDWKRCKDISRINSFNEYSHNDVISHLPNSNFWHYALQLNTYKTILERKYNKIIKDLYLVCLHPDNPEQNYELIKLPILKKEMKHLFLEQK